MDNSEVLAVLDTEDTGRRQTNQKNTMQHKTISNVDLTKKKIDRQIKFNNDN